MKIKRVDAEWLHVPIPEAQQHISDFGRIRSFDCTLVRIETACGIVGHGEAKAVVGSAGNNHALTEMIRTELAAMHDIVSPMGNASVTASVTVTDATPPGQPAPRGYGVLSHQVREAIARQPEPFTPADIAAACGATSVQVWPYLKRGVQAGTLRREHAGKGAPYRRVS